MSCGQISSLKCVLIGENRGSSSLLTDYVYIEILSDEHISRTPRRSLQVDAGVVVGLKEQAVTLSQGSDGSDRQRETWEVLTV